jgi:hypothetical protein
MHALIAWPVPPYAAARRRTLSDESGGRRERAKCRCSSIWRRSKSSGDVLMPPTIKNPAGEDGALGDAQ